jgi:hypothetical protein
MFPGLKHASLFWQRVEDLRDRRVATQMTMSQHILKSRKFREERPLKRMLPERSHQ